MSNTFPMPMITRLKAAPELHMAKYEQVRAADEDHHAPSIILQSLTARGVVPFGTVFCAVLNLGGTTDGAVLTLHARRGDLSKPLFFCTPAAAAHPPRTFSLRRKMTDGAVMLLRR